VPDKLTTHPTCDLLAALEGFNLMTVKENIPADAENKDAESKRPNLKAHNFFPQSYYGKLENFCSSI
jgi:hypothetical protein